MLRGILFSFVVLAGPVTAQESDKDYLTSFLEDSLSDADREVTVTGFTGALSSEATIEAVTIADEDGIWLTLNGVKLNWSRSSLLSGELSVSELSAQKLVISRPPVAQDDGLPAPEAAGFSLPDLPVSIEIDRVAIDSIDLDASILGQAVEGTLEAAVELSGGSGAARLTLSRTGEGPTGQISLDAGFESATGELSLSLVAEETAGGLVAVALGLPGYPSSSFRLVGSGPLEAFAAEISLATDNEERLKGQVTLSGDTTGETRLVAAISGNLAPLFLPEYAEFIGSRLDLLLEARRAASGSVTVDRFDLKAQSLVAEGRAVIAADGLPESLALKGVVASPDGRPLLLPFGELPTRIDRAAFDIATTRDGNLDWQLTAEILGLDRADLVAERLALSGSGRIARGPAGKSFGGTLEISGTGLAPADPGLAKALGSDLSGGLKFYLLESDDALRLSDIKIEANGLSGHGQLRIEGLESAFLTSGKLRLATEDLSRFDRLAGLPLAGRGEVWLEGSASRLSGHVDGEAGVSATGLKVGIDQIDRLLQGSSTARLSILRDENGTAIRSLELQADSASVVLAGKVDSGAIDLEGRVSLADIAALDPAYSGAAKIDIAVTGSPADAQVSLSGMTDGLSLGNDYADRLLRGRGAFVGKLGLSPGLASIDRLQFSNTQVDVVTSGVVGEDLQDLSLTAKLTDLGLLLPSFGGPVSVSGRLTGDGTNLRIDLAGKGPGKLDLKVAGTLAEDLSTGDLTIAGTGQAGLANPFIAPRVAEGPARFDLRLTGPLQLTSLSGRISVSEGRLSDPGLGFALEKIDALASIVAGKAKISTSARLSTGGGIRIEGSVGLATPYSADLSVEMDRVRFFDPKLFETTLNGKLGITGPLAGGAIISGALTLSETEARVPESGIDAAGVLSELRHRNEPAEVRETRARAGLLDTEVGGRASKGAPFRLDLILSAPSRIFLRGRGVDAELGGELRLGGTTAAVVPAGEFHLIRGRLNILGKRLVLDQADLRLEGSLVPHLDILASTETDGITSSVRIEGPASDPDVAFISDLDLPEEEVLAYLLFGRGLDSISALQAARLAQAVATLAGKGGEGIIGQLRKGFGLDDLDVATAEDGTAALKAGKYLSENIYTEIEVDQAGTSKINLNLDLRPGVTAKGRLGADGDTGIGIFIEKDY